VSAAVSGGVSGADAADVAGGRLAEAEALWWREGTSERTLRRDERRWTTWTACVVLVFAVPGALLLYVEPLTFPAAALCFAHAWAIPWLQARRGARSARAIAPGRRAGGGPKLGSDEEAARTALGLLGDLVGHAQRDLLARTGMALERGELGVWLLGQEGALLVRPGGRRVDCWCVGIGEPEGLPAGDRVAHLLLALREDEEGFATVANLNFSGAFWRVRRKLDERARAGLDAARGMVRSESSPRVSAIRFP
jgi:hypothetical protein